MPKDVGGLGIGHGPVSLVTLALVVASFVYLSRTGIDEPEPEAAPVVAAGAASAPWGAGADRYGRPDPYAHRPGESSGWPR